MASEESGVEKVGRVLSNLTNPLELVTGSLEKLGDAGEIAAKAIDAAVKIMEQAIQATKDFYNALNNIKGAIGDIGKMSKTLSGAASGSVSRQDLASFFGSTGELFGSVKAMQQSVGYVNDLIGLYGDVNTAVRVFQESLLLSVEDQAKFNEYVSKANDIIQQTPAAELQKAQNALADLITLIGNDLLYVLKPVLDIISDISDAVRKIRMESGGLGYSETKQMEELQKLAEQYGTTLEDIQAIERGGFLSSLDEAHETGQGFLGNDPFGGWKDSADETSDSLSVVGSILGDILATAFSFFDNIIGPLIDMGEAVWNVQDAFLSLLGVSKSSDSVFDTLRATLEGLGWILEKITGFFELISDWISGIEGMLENLIPDWLMNILKWVFNPGGSIRDLIASKAGGATNEYEGTTESLSRVTPTIYIDSRKVNDALSESKTYDDQVRFT